jgi:hypothetical protein
MDCCRVARFVLTQHTKTGKIYQMAVKYINWQYYTSNGHKIYKPFQIQGPRKFTQTGIFLFENIPSGNPASLLL